MNRALFDFIEKCPSSYHAVSYTKEVLTKAGFTELCENEKWQLNHGGSYFVSRNGSSIIAFKMPLGQFSGYMMAAAHSDSPCFKIKDNPDLCDNVYVRLSTEKYGGSIFSTWMDRPLSVAGRVTVKEGERIVSKLVDLKEAQAIIPSVAIHMNRNVNEEAKYNPAVDMIPLYADTGEKTLLKDKIAEALFVDKEEILSSDLFVYNPASGVEWNDYISAPRLDDLQCAFSGLTALTAAEANFSVPVFCLFDNEEVGSNTRQGAASGFLEDVLERISVSMGLDAIEHKNKMAQSFLISCDNAHGVHPNHPEYADKNHSVYMNKGVVIKTNASQRYSSDAVSAGIFKALCKEAKVPFQVYANRADMAGGSTLGNIVSTRFSLNTVDIGLAQLAMHSAYETAGGKDTKYMVDVLTAFFEKSLSMISDGEYILE